MLADQIQTETINMTPSAVEAVRNLMAERNLEGFALRCLRLRQRLFGSTVWHGARKQHPREGFHC